MCINRGCTPVAVVHSYVPVGVVDAKGVCEACLALLALAGGVTGYRRRRRPLLHHLVAGSLPAGAPHRHPYQRPGLAAHSWKEEYQVSIQQQANIPHVSSRCVRVLTARPCTASYMYARAGMPACCSSRGALRCRFLLLLPGLHCPAARVLDILKLVGEELPRQRMLLALCMRPPWLAAVSMAAAHAGVICGGEMLCNRRRRHAAAWLPAQAWELLLSLRSTSLDVSRHIGRCRTKSAQQNAANMPTPP
jgi:hypothetical protein